jgi:hypothetical protein
MESRDLKTLCVEAIAAACVSRGKRKGTLKATCPPMGSNAAAAWQAMMLEANPYKASIAQIMMLRGEARAIYDAIEASLKGIDLRGLDRDRVALEGLGVW